MLLSLHVLNRRGRRVVVLFSLVVGVLCSILVERAAAGPDNKEERGFYVWPLWARVTLCIVTVLLSAMFCGLTIGLLGIDTVTLEIIASAGAEPERSYAQVILPIRHLGHQLLASLLLGNMLTLVLTSQLVAAIVRSTELVNFVVGTLVVLIFGEILPMAYCNKGCNGLRAGVKSLPVLKAALLVLYPIAKPLGMLLDCMVSHDAGQLYDKNELKKLIHMHYEKYAERSGINQDELRMMLSALEMNEVTVDSAMTPLDRTLMLEASQPLDTALQRRLWEYGKSRIPIYAGTKSNIIGVLYVKDLINVTTLRGDEIVTIREFLQDHPRDVLVVKEKAQLQDALKIFESHYTQMLFVEKVLQGVGSGKFSSTSDEDCSHMGKGLSQPVVAPGVTPLGARQTLAGGDGRSPRPPSSPGLAAKDSAGPTSPPLPGAVLGPSSSRHYRNEGIGSRRVSFQEEAMMGDMASAQRNDGARSPTLGSSPLVQRGEVRGTAHPPADPPAHQASDALRLWMASADTLTPRTLLDPSSTNNRVFVGVVTLEDIIERLIASEIFDEDEYNIASDGASSDTNSDVENELLLRSVKKSVSLQKQPIKMPRVNFYSYGLSPGAMEEDDDLTEEQKWALASYMTRAFVFFASWSVPKVKFLLDELGDKRVFVTSADASEALRRTSSLGREDAGSDRRVAVEEDEREADPAAAVRAGLRRGGGATASVVDPSRVLYTAGQPSHTFTFLLSGGIDVAIEPRAQFRTELRSFSSLGDEIFSSAEPFVPDYTAVVSRNSRLICVSHEDMYRVERKINAIRRQRGRRPVKITTFDTSTPLPMVADDDDDNSARLQASGIAVSAGGEVEVAVLPAGDEAAAAAGSNETGSARPLRLNLAAAASAGMNYEDERVQGG